MDLERIRNAFSSTYWRFEHYGPKSQSLLSLLCEKLPQIAVDSWPERLNFGGVFVNGLAAYGDRSLPIPAKVEYYEPKFPVTDASSYYSQFKKEYILFEDVDLIVVFKPNKLPSMPAKEQRFFNMKTYLENHLGQTVHLPSRLDTSTQGLLIVSKTARMNGPLQNLFARKIIKKFYLFESSTQVPWKNLVVENVIGKHPGHPVLRMVNGEDSIEAQTKFTRIGDTNFVCAQPKTGRTHQIRVHASYVGCPIMGDNFYEGTIAPELHLLSAGLHFLHPFSGENIRISVPEQLFPSWAKPVYNKVLEIVESSSL